MLTGRNEEYIKNAFIYQKTRYFTVSLSEGHSIFPAFYPIALNQVPWFRGLGIKTKILVLLAVIFRIGGAAIAGSMKPCKS
jgi:hypothetical protein